MDVFPTLKQIQEWKGQPFHPKENCLRYIIFMYDPGSPLRHISDPGQRRAMALSLADFNVNDENSKFSDEVEDMISGINPKFNNAVVAFIRILRSPDYSALVMHERIFYNLISQAMESRDLDEKLGASIEKQKKILSEQTKQFLNQDNNQLLMKSVYGYIISQDLDFTPEAVVRKLSKGEEVFPESKQ